MHCPFCQHIDTKVIDSRASEDGATIRRRRRAGQPAASVSTLKRSNSSCRRSSRATAGARNFDARKLRLSMERALHKRPVSEERIRGRVRSVVHQVRMSGERELPSRGSAIS